MEVVYEVAEENLKIWVAALHCLAQIGKELSFEAEGTAQLTCRVLNDAHSASAQLSFDRSFFADVKVISHIGSVRCIPFAKCKVFAKSCCNIFRTLKHVRSLQIGFLVNEESAREAQEESGDAEEEEDEMDVDCEEIRWRLRCDFDITKTHCMKVHASQIMRAVFDKSTCASHLVARQFHLASLLAHIHHSNEVAVTCSETHVKFESYVPATGDGKAQLHTETAVESAEFQAYSLEPNSHSIDSSVQLIFCLKEVRALLSFCKASDVSEIGFYFSTGGSPVLFTAESTAMAKFAVEITLSTVTTFLPASSQTRSDEGPGDATSHLNNDMHDLHVDQDAIMRESDSSQSSQQPRYLTHTKRMRVD
ncbi:hypothetical protein Poli38472_004672 [Pythium oligandrum]|uniref:Cell cycle checkpoint control protein RAD9A n=1 Tax=Pythium oligandrum TaxID=41045 RepID=A0A8K1CBG9_PYTOL|nr:hypothetical protein Poli38472_004672 [Pythium oligandrum]|eukprot:TMW59603.1 hypothetical protein Poli38472_004672 [Pythium oligandrum]